MRQGAGLACVPFLQIGRPGSARIAIPHWLHEGSIMGVYDAIRKCVAFVGYPNERGFSAIGTGFFAYIQQGGLDFGYFITAAHLIRNKRPVSVRINKKDGLSETQETDTDKWIFHCTKNMDICAYPTTLNPRGDTEPHDVLYLTMESAALDGHELHESGLTIGDEVFISGLFASREGEKRNIPIIRTANIAAMPEEPLWPSPAVSYLIETRSLGGTSGSPVFFDLSRAGVTKKAEPPIIGLINQTGGSYPIMIMPYYFIGMILSSHAQRYEDDFFPDGPQADAEFNAGIRVAMTAHDVLSFMNDDPNMPRYRDNIVEKKTRAIGHRPSTAVESSPDVRNGSSS
jgi:hypothetical protein